VEHLDLRELAADFSIMKRLPPTFSPEHQESNVYETMVADVGLPLE
jgi:hypothetical protein